jgi:hypothetical protein
LKQGIARFLLLQTHAFRGRNESSSSSNKGNFSSFPLPVAADEEMEDVDAPNVH